MCIPDEIGRMSFLFYSTLLLAQKSIPGLVETLRCWKRPVIDRIAGEPENDVVCVNKSNFD
jgi:hypothetical protein